MGRYVNYNANPMRNQVGDCVIRAISKAEGKSWDEIYTCIYVEGSTMCDMPTANAVWGSWLRKHGYKQTPIDDKGKGYYTVADFCVDHPQGVYILAMQSHVVAVCDGRYFDTWDCGGEPVIYCWTKGEKEEKR